MLKISFILYLSKACSYHTYQNLIHVKLIKAYSFNNFNHELISVYPSLTSNNLERIHFKILVICSKATCLELLKSQCLEPNLIDSTCPVGPPSSPLLAPVPKDFHFFNPAPYWLQPRRTSKFKHECTTVLHQLCHNQHQRDRSPGP